MRPTHHRLLREGVGPPWVDGRPLRWSASAVRHGARILEGAGVGYCRRQGRLVHPGPGEAAVRIGRVEAVRVVVAADGAAEAWGRLRLDRVPRCVRRALAGGAAGASVLCRAWTSPAPDGGPDLAHGLAGEDGAVIVDIVEGPALAAVGGR